MVMNRIERKDELDDGLITCNICKKQKPLNDFSDYHLINYDYRCKECMNRKFRILNVKTGGFESRRVKKKKQLKKGVVTCIKCNKEKPIYDFYGSYLKQGKFQCIVCTEQIKKERRIKKFPEGLKRRMPKKFKNKKKIIEWKKGLATCCWCKKKTTL